MMELRLGWGAVYWGRGSTAVVRSRALFQPAGGAQMAKRKSKKAGKKSVTRVKKKRTAAKNLRRVR
jgi:hypothetical protein